MKDDKLEQQFEEYFKGLNTPENITCDAKKYVTKKSAVLPKIVKFACIAASFALVFAVSLIVVFNRDFPADAPPANDAAGDAAGTVTRYDDDDLSYETVDAYTLSTLNNSLKFIELYAHSSGASVNVCTAGYANGELTIVKAELSLTDKLNRHDTQICVEFTAEGVYAPIADYREGSQGTYRGAEYYLTQETAENGEPVNKMYINYGGVGYYVCVTSSDRYSYEKYLEKIVK